MPSWLVVYYVSVAFYVYVPVYFVVHVKLCVVVVVHVSSLPMILMNQLLKDTMFEIKHIIEIS